MNPLELILKASSIGKQVQQKAKEAQKPAPVQKAVQEAKKALSQSNKVIESLTKKRPSFDPVQIASDEIKKNAGQAVGVKQLGDVFNGGREFLGGAMQGIANVPAGIANTASTIRDASMNAVTPLYQSILAKKAPENQQERSAYMDQVRNVPSVIEKLRVKDRDLAKQADEATKGFGDAVAGSSSPSAARYVGGIVGQMVPQAIGGLAGKAPQMLGLLALGGGAEEYNKSRDAGKSSLESLLPGILGGLTTYGTSKIGIIPNYKGSMGSNVVSDALIGAAREGSEEGLDTFLKNATARFTYDPERKGTDNLLEAIQGGAIGGGIFGGAARMATDRGAKLPTYDQTVKSNLEQSRLRAEDLISQGFNPVIANLISGKTTRQASANLREGVDGFFENPEVQQALKPDGFQSGVDPIGKLVKATKAYRRTQSTGQKNTLDGRTEPSSVPVRDVPDRPTKVKQDIDQKISSFIEDTLGYSTADPSTKGKSLVSKLLTPVEKVNTAWTNILRKGQDKLGSTLEGATNPIAKKAANVMQGFFRNVASSPDTVNAEMKFRGGIATANQRAYDVMTSLYDLAKSDPNTLERVNAVLDPELAKQKVSFKDLNPQEQQLYNLVRRGFDLVHDISYDNGAIDAGKYEANKGKYVPRMYDIFEMPAEISDFVKEGSKKLATDLYKSKTEVDDWKLENSLNDPVYALGKRLAQVETNRAIKQFSDYIKQSPNLVSDAPKDGFTQLSESKAYGDLAGKWVKNNIAEDIQGFFFQKEGTQKLYDFFKWYDSTPLRRGQKKALTVYNPTTHLGNIVSDNVFGFMVGVDPLTLNKNLAWITRPKNKATFNQYRDYLTRNGILGTDITRSDFAQKLSDVDALAESKTGKKTLLQKLGIGLNKIDEKVTGFYGGTDDYYKIAAFKSLIDQGKSLPEATRLVADGFQNYANVGKYYDMYAKAPVVGAAFVKFQGDLLRMMKNAAVNRPLQLATFLMGLKAVADYSSSASGESPEDREVREKRLGSPVIPGLNIPLAWQTPMGEVNVARYIVPFYMSNAEAQDGVRSAVGRFVPGGSILDVATNLTNTRDQAAAFASLAQDPLLSPFVNIMLDRDFRGKSIQDPDSTKYKESTLTDDEKMGNIANFIFRSYTPPFVNSLKDFTSNIQGKKDYYGKSRDPLQAVLRVAGVKVEEFGPEQAEETRQKNASYNESRQENIKKQLREVNKQLFEGTISEEQANARRAEWGKEAEFDVQQFVEEDLAKKFNTKEKPAPTAEEERVKAEKAAAKKERDLARNKDELNVMTEAIRVKYLNLPDDQIVQTIRAKRPEFSEDSIRYAIRQARR